MLYKEEFTFGAESFDGKGNIYPYYVLEIFEKAATEHGERIGVGFSKMRELNLMWIISQIKYQVIKNPAPDEALTIKTWPLKPDPIGYRREFLILNNAGEEIIKGSSVWLTIDATTRKLVIGGSVFPSMEFSEDINFEKRLLRIRETECGEKISDIVPKSNHIDYNGHVNNKHYTTFVLNAIKEFDGLIDIFQIDYVQEIMPGEKVSLYVLKNGNETVVKGENDGAKKFLSKIIYK